MVGVVVRRDPKHLKNVVCLESCVARATYLVVYTFRFNCSKQASTLPDFAISNSHPPPTPHSTSTPLTTKLSLLLKKIKWHFFATRTYCYRDLSLATAAIHIATLYIAAYISPSPGEAKPFSTAEKMQLYQDYIHQPTSFYF